MLKLAGEWGSDRHCAPWRLCVRRSILRLARMRCTNRQTGFMNGIFCAGLMRRYRRKAALYPHIYGKDRLWAESVR